ncbi:hypothetical protein PCAR4_570215 [Paraburkholderia caribensis]|nr:hypothetical protein PCAR4_570215 [Paraburkholderia caribensis]
MLTDNIKELLIREAQNARMQVEPFSAFRDRPYGWQHLFNSQYQVVWIVTPVIASSLACVRRHLGCGNRGPMYAPRNRSWLSGNEVSSMYRF